MATFPRRNDLLYPELSYKIIGCAFDLYNTIGHGHLEKFYQNGMRAAFEAMGLKFKEQVYAPLKYKDKVIGRGFRDFLVEDKIIVEIKKGEHFSKTHIEQVFEYLVTNKIELAILINFGLDRVHFKRIINKNSL